MGRLRRWFFGFNAVVAIAIGTVAVGAPGALLESKGVALPNDAAEVWVREVGVMILALGVTLWLVRGHAGSATLRALCAGAAVVHFGMLPVELWAHAQGTIPALLAVAPNSILHACMAGGFVWLSLTNDAAGATPSS
jgi:creatinine amidohydrolase/Fe(II)-dependent formamide hydrolase-like protein